MYIYIKTEPNLWTVGFYAPDGTWHTDGDHPAKAYAATRVHYLNGGNVRQVLENLEKLIRALTDETADFWPKNPYPETLFPMPEERYAEIVPDPHLRTALSGMLGRRFWDLTLETIRQAMTETMEE